MTTDMTRLLAKLNPPRDGEDVLRLRRGLVDAIVSVSDDPAGSVDVNLDGVIIEGVPALNGAVFVVGQEIEILIYRGKLLVIGTSGSVSGQPVVAASANTTGGTVTPGVSFTNTLASTGIHGVAFVAPASGIVNITGRAVGRNDTAGGFVLLDFEVRAGDTVGSGSVTRAASTNTAGVFESSTAGQEATLVTGSLITGLTPGAVYNTALAYAAGAAAQQVAYNRRHMTVLPQ